MKINSSGRRCLFSRKWVKLIQDELISILKSEYFLGMYFLKVNGLIYSSWAEVYFITEFNLNNLFEFHRTWPVDVQSIIEFLKLIHIFLARDNIRSSVCIFFAVRLEKCFVVKWLVHSVSVALLKPGEQIWFPCSSVVVDIKVKLTNPTVC